ncbi:hypothetical protein [Pedobacter aquatilis]|uniref:hypothetical protein n=1 Tax=Pedobacter aquatilis TaxID=351343 RepID=UPI00292E60B0|nr:hypothetical protein [Pedobacter aquatilis]
MFSGDRTIGLGSPNGRGSASTDNKYCIEFETNHPAKTQLITWIGTIFEEEEKRRKENEERERYFRDVLGEKLETKTVVLTGKVNVIKKIKPDNSTPTYSSELSDKITSFNFDIKPSELIDFESFEEYEFYLNEAISLFGARPGSPEYRRLMILIFKIDHYERNELIFPEANLIESIKHRMELFQMDASSFRDILGENDFTNFLEGNFKLKAYTRNRVLTRLGLGLLIQKRKKN